MNAARAALRPALLLGFAALAGGFALFRAAPHEPPAELRLVDSVSIATLDPAEISWLPDIRVVTQIYEGLYAPAADGRSIEPGCANLFDDGFTNSERRVWRFAIRPSARWSNGDPVTADDFLFAWRRALEPGTARDYAFFFDTIRGVREYVAWRHSEIERIGRLPEGERQKECDDHLRAADERFARVGLVAESATTLRIELVRPIAYFAELLACPVFLPLHRATVAPFRRVGDTGVIYYDPAWCKAGRTHYNGAYRLVAWRFKRGLRLERNPLHRDAAKIAIGSIDWLDVADPGTAWLMYDTGAVDWLLSLESRFAPEIVARSRSPLAGALNQSGTGRDDVHAFRTLGTCFYNFNCAPRLPDGSVNPLNDARLRRAISLAIDREAICTSVTRRGEPPARTFVPPGLLAGYPAVSGMRFDPAAAKRLLAEAGWTDPVKLPELVLLFDNEGEQGLVAQAVAAMVEQHLGIRLRLVGKESQSYREDKQRHAFSIARASWYADYADPTSYLDVFRSDNGNNDSAYHDADYDRRLAAADALADPRERLAALAACEERLLSVESPLLPLYHYVNVYAYNPAKIAGVALGPRLVPALKSVRVTR